MRVAIVEILEVVNIRHDDGYGKPPFILSLPMSTYPEDQRLEKGLPVQQSRKPIVLD